VTLRRSSPSLSEDLRFKDEDVRTTPPGARGQSSLDTRMIEERIAVPPVLARHLRQQQSAVRALLDDQPVRADLDFLDRLDLALAREDRDFEADAGELLRRDAIESGIRVRHGLCELRDEPGDRQRRIQLTETAPQFAVVKNRDERTAVDVGGKRALDVRKCSVMDARLQGATE